MDYEYSGRAQGLLETVQAIAQGTQHLDPDEQEEILMQVVNGYTRLDLPYLRALYFPECSQAARIPTKFPVPTGLVTQKFSFYLNTGGTGSGYVGMCPQDTTYFPCFRSEILSSAAAAQYGAGNKIQFIGESSNYLPQSFSHGRLVGASMQISWIGQADQEAGFLCSSHLFDTAPVCLSETVIEEGFYPVRAPPSHGIRLCYIPKDDEDTEFAQLNYQIQYVKGSDSNEEMQKTYDISTWFDGPALAGATNPALGNSLIADGISDLVPLVLEVNDPKTSSQISWNAVPPSLSRAPNNYYGLHKHKGAYGNPNMMVCYWKGLPIGKDWLRVDVVRHFEVLPRQQIKDLIAVGRTKPSPETLSKVSDSSSDMAHVHNTTIAGLTQMQQNEYRAQQDLQANSSRRLDSQYAQIARENALHEAGQKYVSPMTQAYEKSHPVVGMSSGMGQSLLSTGRDNRMLNATLSGLKMAGKIFSFLPASWLDKPLLSLINKGINYGTSQIEKAAAQGGGGTFGLSQGTPSYTRLVLQ